MTQNVLCCHPSYCPRPSKEMFGTGYRLEQAFYGLPDCDQRQLALDYLHRAMQIAADLHHKVQWPILEAEMVADTGKPLKNLTVSDFETGNGHDFGSINLDPEEGFELYTLLIWGDAPATNEAGEEN